MFFFLSIQKNKEKYHASAQSDLLVVPSFSHVVGIIARCNHCCNITVAGIGAPNIGGGDRRGGAAVPSTDFTFVADERKVRDDDIVHNAPLALVTMWTQQPRCCS